MSATISAWKEIPGGYTPCEVTDSLAVKYEVHYSGAYCGMPLEFDSKYKAEQVRGALETAFNAGKKQQLRELRNFMGIRE